MAEANPDSKVAYDDGGGGGAKRKDEGPEDYTVEKVKDEPKRDYSGAVTVTDPAEAALVRKLDWRIMV